MCHRWLDTHNAVMNLGKHENDLIACCCLAYRLLYPGDADNAICMSERKGYALRGK